MPSPSFSAAWTSTRSSTPRRPGRHPAPAVAAAARTRRARSGPTTCRRAARVYADTGPTGRLAVPRPGLLGLLQGAPRWLRPPAAVGRLGRGHPRTIRIRCFESMRAQCPVHQVRLADGHDAWLVLGHEAARQALKDARLSKDMVAALDDDPDVVDAGLPGPALRASHADRRSARPRSPAPPRFAGFHCRLGSPRSTRRSSASPTTYSTSSKPAGPGRGGRPRRQVSPTRCLSG